MLRSRAIQPPYAHLAKLHRWRVFALWVGMLVTVFALSWTLPTLELLALVPALVLAAVAAIAWRPQLGVYIVLFLVALFEVESPDPLMFPGSLLHLGFSSTLGVSAFAVSPLELLMFLTLCSWLAHAVLARRVSLRGGPLVWPLLLFLGTFVFGLARGAASGGDMEIALWESRWLSYTFVYFFLAANTLTSHRPNALLGIVMVATILFAIDGLYRRLVLDLFGGRRFFGSNFDYAFDHTDVVFLGACLLLVIAQQIFGAPRWMRVIGLLSFPIMAFTMLATERRAGMIGIMVAFLALAVVLLFARWRAFAVVVPPVLLAAAVYLPLFWNNTGILGQPARAIQSLIQPSWRDAQSNLYRELEKTNVLATIRSDPALGVGFGREYLFVVPMPDLSHWRFWRYEPHNNVMWIWLKTGILGFVAFCALFGLAIARAAHLARRSTGTTRMFAIFSLCAVVMSTVVSYVDVALVAGGRIPILLGVVLGTLSVLDRSHEKTTP